ncbi:21573_t:CDS:2, partial [Entrophospora sp. SA101]
MIQQIINNKRIYNNLVKEKNERKLKLNTTNAITTTNNDIVISIEDEEKTNDERGEKNNNGSEDYYVLEKGYDDNNSEDSGDEGDNNYKVPPEVEQLNDFRTSVELLVQYISSERKTRKLQKTDSKMTLKQNIVLYPQKNNNGSEDYYVLEKGYDDNNSEDSGDEGDNNYKVPPEVEQLNDFRTSVELLTFRQNKIESKLLSEYNIVEGSHIQLMVLLYSISKDQSLNNLTFDLFLGFPEEIVIAWMDLTLNYGSTGHVDLKCISHSGDVMDFANKK